MTAFDPKQRLERYETQADRAKTWPERIPSRRWRR
jgi:hypothetical protein